VLDPYKWGDPVAGVDIESGPQTLSSADIHEAILAWLLIRRDCNEPTVVNEITICV